MKKYHIIDEAGEAYEVEEIEEESPVEAAPAASDAALTDEEIAALKQLASVADKLIALCSDEVADEGLEEDPINSDDIEAAEEEEQVVDTCSLRRDSRRSFGAIETRTKKLDDSLTDTVADAWAKRFGGVK